jgi:hypothetical protein
MVPMPLKLTRRQLAAAVSASTALLAQQPPAPLPQNPEEELKAAREQLRQASEALAKFDLPMSTEPAVHFKA